MLKQIIVIILLGLIGPLLSFTVELDQQEGTCKPFIDFYANNLVSAEVAGQGYAGVADVGGISFSNINPASFDIKNDAQIYYEYGLKNNTNLFSDLKAMATILQAIVLVWQLLSPTNLQNMCEPE